MLASSLLCLSLIQVSPSSEVLVVDAQGAGDYATIQDAIDAAQGGEIILVHSQSGVFAGFDVVGKSLVITSDHADYPVQVAGIVRVVNVAPGQEVVLQGLQVVEPGDAGEPEALRIDHCGGSVRVEHCSFFGADNMTDPDNCQGFLQNQGFDGAAVRSSANVAFVACGFYGGRGVELIGDVFEKDCEFWTQGGRGGRGLYCSFSSLALFGCTAQGGRGGQGGWGGDGGQGILLEATPDQVQVISGTTGSGGEGGFGFDWAYGPGGDGGSGLVVYGLTYLQDSVLLGGQGGGSVLFSDGAAGFDLEGGPISWTGEARDLKVHGPVQEGSTLKLTFQGQPSDYALLFVSVSQSFLLFPQYQGVALIGTAKALPGGVCGATGKLELLVPVPPLQPSYEGVVVAAQAVFISTAGGIFAGPPGHAVVLDAAF